MPHLQQLRHVVAEARALLQRAEVCVRVCVVYVVCAFVCVCLCAGVSVFRTDPTLVQIPEELLSRRLRWPSEIVSGSTCNALVPVHKCLI